jgi:hypothetical protein
MPVAPYRCPEGPVTYGFSAALSASREGIRLQRNFGSGLMPWRSAPGAVPLALCPMRSLPSAMRYALCALRGRTSENIAYWCYLRFEVLVLLSNPPTNLHSSDSI